MALSANSFRSFTRRVLKTVTDMAGEIVKIDSWSGKAVVNGGPAPFADTPGGGYEKDTLTLSVRKCDLGEFIPAPQMNVEARGKALRIPDDGIIEYAERYFITAVGRNVPR